MHRGRAQHLLGAVADPVVGIGERAVGAGAVLQPPRGRIGIALGVARRDVVGDAGEVEIVGAAVAAVDDRRAGARILDHERVEQVILGVALGQRQPVGVGDRGRLALRIVLIDRGTGIRGSRAG